MLKIEITFQSPKGKKIKIKEKDKLMRELLKTTLKYIGKKADGGIIIKNTKEVKK